MTRKEAIDLLDNLNGMIEDSRNSDYDTAFKMAIKALEHEPRWIPVSERLPEKNTYTLWCASSGYVRSDYFNGEFWKDAKKYCYEVIAWMPLPEEYKTESEVEE